MCNPRRVTVTATREIQESWQREVERRVELSEAVVGEARVVQNLGDTLGDSVLMALRRVLARGAEGWEAVGEGYRHQVEGGYVVYHPGDQTLEIVAADQAVVHGEAVAQRVLAGELQGTRSTEADGTWYDDHWGGRTEEVARQEAEALAQQRLDREVRQHLEAEQAAAEQEVEAEVEEEARARARERLLEAAREERERLARQARDNLQNVGVRSNLAFNRLLAGAMRDALEAYARRHGGEVVQCSDGQDVLEMEIVLAA